MPTGKHIPAAVYREVVKRDTPEGRDFPDCFYCKKPIQSSYDLTLDHKVPREEGGEDVPDNLIPACRSCNSRKGRKSFEGAIGDATKIDTTLGKKQKYKPQALRILPYAWKPGQSGNPAGRPSHQTMTNEIKRLTGGGIEMAHVMLKIMRAETIPGVWGSPTYKDIREATVWLAEQCFGRAPLTIAANDDTYDLQRILLLELTKRANDPGVFTIEPETISTKDMAAQQSLQDKNQR